jgi:hypothetical protein
MMPRPSHVGQIWENDSTRPEDTRLRVTCIKPSWADLEHLRSCLVDRQRIPHRVLDLLLVLLEEHVDEVDHDDAADVAEPELTGDLSSRFQVRVDDRRLEVRLARRSCRC